MLVSTDSRGNIATSSVGSGYESGAYATYQRMHSQGRVDMRPNLADIEAEIQVLRDSKADGLRVNVEHFHRLCVEMILRGRILVWSHDDQTRRDPHFISWSEDIADNQARASFSTAKTALRRLLSRFDRKLVGRRHTMTAITGATAGRRVRQAEAWQVEDAVLGPMAATIHALGALVLKSPELMAAVKGAGVQLPLALWSEGGAA